MEPNAVQGFDCIIESQLPIGAGISSSAALECGMAKGLNELFGIGLTDEQIISLSRNAEHSFVGTKCGVMDQFAVVKGKENRVLFLDCKTEKHKVIGAKFAPYLVLLLNTNVSHNLANSEYNVRIEECGLALQKIASKYPNYKFLADVPQNIVEEFKSEIPEKIFNRALFVSQENNRVHNSVSALNNELLDEFGELMCASHNGLQNLYEVSCPELDFLVDFSKRYNAILGSRMMGGGFGGCTINIIHQDFVDEYLEIVSEAYMDRFNIGLSPILVEIGDGVEVIKQK
ncbi:galactokinase [Saonia flava]|uniref:Galactokinase n=1 Tax=Saonia flava TaxID=523696 RepID=A0A846R103_9FLAO|nr:galactokinase [Saonia flava]NJB72840.1 galactokinase [Saonia flava]